VSEFLREQTTTGKLLLIAGLGLDGGEGTDEASAAVLAASAIALVLLRRRARDAV
jgi:hypothetical protein